MRTSYKGPTHIARSALALLLLLLLSFSATFAQTHLLDSLKNVLANTNKDSARIRLLIKLVNLEPDYKTGIKYGLEGIAIAEKSGDKRGQADVTAQLAGHMWSNGNLPLALHYATSALRIREGLADTAGIANCYAIFGVVYREMSDYANASLYIHKALRGTPPAKKYSKAFMMGYMGRVFYESNQLDSALYYYQRSYELFDNKNFYQIAASGLGDIQYKKGRYDIALGYYREAIANAREYADQLAFCDAYARISTLYNTTHQQDSAIFYAKLALRYSQELRRHKEIGNMASMLAALYAGDDVSQQIKYLTLAKAASDSLYALQKSGQVQSLLLDQKEREQMAAAQAADQAHARAQNLQYVLIAIGLMTLLLLFLLLSRRMITSARVIEICGVVALLLVFEFINLLIHPYLERVTHHSPVLMLLGLVGVAALLVPLHHKIEHWATTSLIAKNKAIRLAAARRTIEKLDVDVG